MTFEFLTIGEAAGLLRIHRRTLYRLIAKGWIQALHISPGKRMIEARELEDYVERRRRGGSR